MLSKFYNYFFPQKNNPDIRISFNIDDITNNNILVKVEYKNTSIDTCKYIAKILFMLNKGFLMKHMIEAINRLPINNHEFAVQVLKEWDNLYLLENYNDPIISPSDAFSRHTK